MTHTDPMGIHYDPARNLIVSRHEIFSRTPAEWVAGRAAAYVETAAAPMTAETAQRLAARDLFYHFGITA